MTDIRSTGFFFCTDKKITNLVPEFILKNNTGYITNESYITQLPVFEICLSLSSNLESA